MIEQRITPGMFCQRLEEKARQTKKKIVLPEGDEPRTLKAAAICVERGLAHCILLGDAEKIRQAAEENNVNLFGIEIIEPSTILERYVAPMVELRKSKGLTAEMARQSLVESNTVLGTMMLQCDDVDGLVSGAIHTTADTVRPALQLIKMKVGVKLVSSVYFMCLPEQVLVYGDCAINPNPTAEELADIAIQSADTAMAFGIFPRVAKISYSTGTSGAGESVDKVLASTLLVKARRPDLLIDGPIQYDAAVDETVAKIKLPNSLVAGKATVIIFPDLNTGNTTYKAVQRSANITCIGPLLQGLNKPVNDLSRGCLVEDIVFTIALTANQAISE